MQRKLKVYGSCGANTPTSPRITMQGRWLEDCGFQIGDQITVESTGDGLIIRKAAGLKVAVIGSRSIHKADLSAYISKECTMIISGGAKGVDTLAEQYAKTHGIETLILKPDYGRFQRGAPLHRNEEIVRQADMVLAFWDGVSRGTKYTIDYAEKMGKPVKVITITESAKT